MRYYPPMERELTERQLAIQNMILLPILFCIWMYIPVCYYLYVPISEQTINTVVWLWLVFIFPSITMLSIFIETLYKLKNGVIIY